MKFLKTIRFDPSDTHVFEIAAEPDEWSISGGFWFSGITKDQLKGKVKQAFSNGFLSLDSFGFSTFVSVVEIDSGQLKKITNQLAERLVSHFDAPSLEEAYHVASEEIEYVVKLCEKVPVNSVFALKRELQEDGQMHESFSLVEAPRGQVHTKVWEIAE